MKRVVGGAVMLDLIGMRRIWLAGVMLLVGLLAGPLLAHPASASIGFCRTDPIIKLSNGTVMRLTVEIRDDAADVQQVTYTVHAPAGMTLDQVHYTGPLASMENVKFFADNPANTYDTDTFVSTGAPRMDVAVSTDVNRVGSGSASGTNGQDLLVHIAG